jgi:hypothetical protein
MIPNIPSRAKKRSWLCSESVKKGEEINWFLSFIKPHFLAVYGRVQTVAAGILYLQHYAEQRAQLHFRCVLPSEKPFLYSLRRRRWTHSWSGLFKKERNLCWKVNLISLSPLPMSSYLYTYLIPVIHFSIIVWRSISKGRYGVFMYTDFRMCHKCEWHSFKSDYFIQHSRLQM